MKKLSEQMALYKGIGPGFHAMRHILSMVILCFHAYVLAFGGSGNIGYVKDKLIENAGALSPAQMVIELLRPGLFALVGAFFALSGFLVAGSALRTKSINKFLWLRAIRITPALCTEVTLSAIVLGLFFTELSYRGYFTSPMFYQYFGNIIGLITYTLPGVFTDNPYPNIVNANLWTLRAEFYCYAIMAGLMLTGFVFNRKRYLYLFLAGLLALIALMAIDSSILQTRADSTHFSTWFLVYFFFLGILFYLFSDKVILHPLLFAVAAMGYFVCMLFKISDFAAAILLVYCMVYVGMAKFPWFDRLVKGDYSYGIYLYGYPITQAVIAVLHPYLDAFTGPTKWAMVAIPTILLTSLFSYFSWHFIEKPSLKLKNYQPTALFRLFRNNGGDLATSKAQ